MNGNCQVIFCLTLLSYKEATELLHRAYFIPAATQQIPPAVTYSAAMGCASASCLLHPAGLTAHGLGALLNSKTLPLFSPSVQREEKGSIVPLGTLIDVEVGLQIPPSAAYQRRYLNRH